MKKILVVIAALAMLLSGCSTTKTQNDKVQIYTSFYAMYDFANEIAGDKADVYNLVQTGVEPHDFEPTADDMKNILNADVFVYNGHEMEHWVEDSLQTISQGKAKVVEASKGMPVELNASDPHIWLDPDNALYEMEQIKNALVEVDADNAQYYEDNYNACAQKIADLKTKYSELNGNGKGVVVTHEAYGYLFNVLNLKQVSIEGMFGSSDPSPTDISKIVEYIKQNGVKYVFAEELDSNKVAQSVANEAGAEVLTLSPFEGSADGKGYFEVMEENLESLKLAVE